jgi:hypothetical protein
MESIAIGSVFTGFSDEHGFNTRQSSLNDFVELFSGHNTPMLV